MYGCLAQFIAEVTGDAAGETYGNVFPAIGIYIPPEEVFKARNDEGTDGGLHTVFVYEHGQRGQKAVRTGFAIHFLYDVAFGEAVSV